MVSNLSKGCSASKSQVNADARQRHWGEWRIVPLNGQRAANQRVKAALQALSLVATPSSDPMMTSLPVFKSHWKSGFSWEIARFLSFSN